MANLSSSELLWAAFEQADQKAKDLWGKADALFNYDDILGPQSASYEAAVAAAKEADEEREAAFQAYTSSIAPTKDINVVGF